MSCELCESVGGELLWQDAQCRVVLVDDADYPGFCRVIWREHVKEMTDLPETGRRHLMDVVFGTERALRRCLAPDKINLASLGNLTPHLHWHVIPRYRDDRHFPNPIWGLPMRETDTTWQGETTQELREALAAELTKSDIFPTC